MRVYKKREGKKEHPHFPHPCFARNSPQTLGFMRRKHCHRTTQQATFQLRLPQPRLFLLSLPLKFLQLMHVHLVRFLLEYQLAFVKSRDGLLEVEGGIVHSESVVG